MAICFYLKATIYILLATFIFSVICTDFNKVLPIIKKAPSNSPVLNRFFHKILEKQKDLEWIDKLSQKYKGIESAFPMFDGGEGGINPFAISDKFVRDTKNNKKRGLNRRLLNTFRVNHPLFKSKLKHIYPLLHKAKSLDDINVEMGRDKRELKRQILDVDDLDNGMTGVLKKEGYKTQHVQQKRDTVNKENNSNSSIIKRHDVLGLKKSVTVDEICKEAQKNSVTSSTSISGIKVKRRPKRTSLANLLYEINRGINATSKLEMLRPKLIDTDEIEQEKCEEDNPDPQELREMETIVEPTRSHSKEETQVNTMNAKLDKTPAPNRYQYGGGESTEPDVPNDLPGKSVEVTNMGESGQKPVHFLPSNYNANNNNANNFNGNNNNENNFNANNNNENNFNANNNNANNFNANNNNANNYNANNYNSNERKEQNTRPPVFEATGLIQPNKTTTSSSATTTSSGPTGASIIVIVSTSGSAIRRKFLKKKDIIDNGILTQADFEEDDDATSTSIPFNPEAPNDMIHSDRYHGDHREKDLIIDKNVHQTIKTGTTPIIYSNAVRKIHELTDEEKLNAQREAKKLMDVDQEFNERNEPENIKYKLNNNNNNNNDDDYNGGDDYMEQGKRPIIINYFDFLDKDRLDRNLNGKEEIDNENDIMAYGNNKRNKKKSDQLMLKQGRHLLNYEDDELEKRYLSDLDYENGEGEEIFTKKSLENKEKKRFARDLNYYGDDEQEEEEGDGDDIVKKDEGRSVKNWKFRHSKSKNKKHKGHLKHLSNKKNRKQFRVHQNTKRLIRDLNEENFARNDLNKKLGKIKDFFGIGHENSYNEDVPNQFSSSEDFEDSFPLSIGRQNNQNQHVANVMKYSPKPFSTYSPTTHPPLSKEIATPPTSNPKQFSDSSSLLFIKTSSPKTLLVTGTSPLLNNLKESSTSAILVSSPSLNPTPDYQYTSTPDYYQYSSTPSPILNPNSVRSTPCIAILPKQSVNKILREKFHLKTKTTPKNIHIKTESPYESTFPATPKINTINLNNDDSSYKDDEEDDDELINSAGPSSEFLQENLLNLEDKMKNLQSDDDVVKKLEKYEAKCTKEEDDDDDYDYLADEDDDEKCTANPNDKDIDKTSVTFERDADDFPGDNCIGESNCKCKPPTKRRTTTTESCFDSPNKHRDDLKQEAYAQFRNYKVVEEDVPEQETVENTPDKNAQTDTNSNNKGNTNTKITLKARKSSATFVSTNLPDANEECDRCGNELMKELPLDCNTTESCGCYSSTYGETNPTTTCPPETTTKNEKLEKAKQKEHAKQEKEMAKLNKAGKPCTPFTIKVTEPTTPSTTTTSTTTTKPTTLTPSTTPTTTTTATTTTTKHTTTTSPTTTTTCKTTQCTTEDVCCLQETTTPPPCDCPDKKVSLNPKRSKKGINNTNRLIRSFLKKREERKTLKYIDEDLDDLNILNGKDFATKSSDVSYLDTQKVPKKPRKFPDSKKKVKSSKKSISSLKRGKQLIRTKKSIEDQPIYLNDLEGLDYETNEKRNLDDNYFHGHKYYGGSRNPLRKYDTHKIHKNLRKHSSKKRKSAQLNKNAPLKIIKKKETVHDIIAQGTAASDSSFKCEAIRGQLSAKIIEHLIEDVNHCSNLKKIIGPLLKLTHNSSNPLPNVEEFRKEEKAKNVKKLEIMLDNIMNSLNSIIKEEVKTKTCMRLDTDSRKFLKYITSYGSEPLVLEGPGAAKVDKYPTQNVYIFPEQVNCSTQAGICDPRQTSTTATAFAFVETTTEKPSSTNIAFNDEITMKMPESNMLDDFIMPATVKDVFATGIISSSPASITSATFMAGTHSSSISHHNQPLVHHQSPPELRPHKKTENFLKSNINNSNNNLLSKTIDENTDSSSCFSNVEGTMQEIPHKKRQVKHLMKMFNKLPKTDQDKYRCVYDYLHTQNILLARVLRQLKKLKYKNYFNKYLQKRTNLNNLEDVFDDPDMTYLNDNHDNMERMIWSQNDLKDTPKSLDSFSKLAKRMLSDESKMVEDDGNEAAREEIRNMKETLK